MSIPHHALILVTDGRKILFMRNQGDRNQIDLRVETYEQRQDAPNRELASDGPGSVYQSGTPARSTYQETDFNRLDKDRWAEDAADQVNQRALKGDFEELVIIAPPRALGEIRKHLHREAESRLMLEIDKEMTDHPVADIEQLINAQTARKLPPEILT